MKNDGENKPSPPNFLKRIAFPSMTGLEAKAPMLPNPNTAVPLETTPTRCPLAVYS